MAEITLWSRVLYAIKMGWRFRRALGHYLNDPQLQIKKITDLKQEFLHKLSIEVLVLDFDGVLGGDHAHTPLASVEPWLQEMYQYYQEKLFILSNKPLLQRELYFKEHYPKINFIKGVAKKPYPQGLLMIQQKTGVNKAHILFCDDRLMTGILASELAGIRALWVTCPIKNLLGRFWHEVFFMTLRFMDRVFLRIFGSHVGSRK